LTDDSLQEIRNELLALSITAVDILNGAAYLFQKEPNQDNQHWKADLEWSNYERLWKWKKI
jgi:hypothetical protein